jgi:integrase
VSDVAPQPSEPGSDLVQGLHERATLVATLQNPEITLARAAATYILFKRRRLTSESERGYRHVLDELTINHPGARLHDFDPPTGTLVIEEFLTTRWGHLAPRTYNKSHSILSDFFEWHVARGTLLRSPMGTLDRAKTRPVLRMTFSDVQVMQILAANTPARDQIALRLLLFFGIRKGALRGVRLDHFDVEKRRLTVFTKGEKIHTLPIVDDDTIWQLLADLREPGHHYLLPKQKNRKRIPPTRSALKQLVAAVASTRVPLAAAAADAQCARELADVLDALELVDVRLTLAIEAASTQTTKVDLTQPIGKHGAHLWWYRCLARAGVVAKGQTAGRRMHGARHTAIQRVLDKTQNLKAAQQLAGHANIGTTGDTYTDWTLEQQAETMREVLA